MYLNSKKISLVLLGITSILCSRTMFAFFNDPEGPNLLIVVVMAAILFAVSLPVYTYYPSVKPESQRRLLLPIFTQMIVVVCLYFCLA